MALHRINDPYNSPAGGTVAPTYDFGSALSPVAGGGGGAGSNPFSAVLAAAAGGGGGGSAVAAPAASPLPSYNGLIDPSRPGLLGLIGRMSGAPTREEAMQAKYADAQRQGLLGLQKRIDEGMPLAQAVTEFMGSPEGVSYFTSGGTMDGLKSFMQTMQKTRDLKQVGNAVVDFTNPDAPKELYKTTPEATGEQRDFEYFAKKAGWSDEQIASAAGDLLKKKTSRNLIPTTIMGPYGPQPAIMDPDTMAVTPITVTGQAPGGTPAATQPGAGGPAQPQGSVVPSISNPAPVGSPEAQKATSADDEGRPSGDIIFGTGPYSVIQSTAGAYLGPLSPDFVNTENDSRQNAVSQIQFAAQQLRGSGTGSRAVSSDVKRLDQIVKGVSSFTDPLQLGQSYLDFWDYLDRQEATAKKRVSEPDLDTGTRKDWSDRLAEVRSVREMLPSRESIKASMDAYKKAPSQVQQAIKNGPAAAKTALDKAETASKDAENAAGFPQQPAPDIAAKTFTTEAEVQKALTAGTIKYGDTIMFNGQPMRVEQ